MTDGLREHVSMKCGVKGKWLETFKRAVRKCGIKCNTINPGRAVSLWQSDSAANDGAFWTYSVWMKGIYLVVVQGCGARNYRWNVEIGKKLSM